MKYDISHEMYVEFMFHFLTPNKMYVPSLMIAF